MCLDQKNWTTYSSSNQKELRRQVATNYNLLCLHVAQKAIKLESRSAASVWKYVIEFSY